MENSVKRINTKYVRDSTDSFILEVNDVNTVFEIINKLINTKTSHIEIPYIPLEVCVGIADYNTDNDFKLTIKKEVIRFLKTYIISEYHKWYRHKHNDSIKKTFIVITNDFYSHLEPLDQKECEEIRQNNKIFYVIDQDIINLRAMVFDFLRKIGHEKSTLYSRIDSVYIQPPEYSDITKTLEEKRVVFISGTPEYGKTYTAVKLLWKYYKRGYNPIWIRGEEPIERVNLRKQMENIDAFLKSKDIVYFEDPFGKIHYEQPYNLERKIGTIVETIKNIEDSYVIITSREEVFKQFEKVKTSAIGISQFINILNIKKPSYDSNKRKEMLSAWAEAKNCKWYTNRTLYKNMIKLIENENYLPTPLSIQSFTIATIGIDNNEDLKRIINEKSGEIAKVFASEILYFSNDMTKDIRDTKVPLSGETVIVPKDGNLKETITWLHISDTLFGDNRNGWDYSKNVMNFIMIWKK